MDDKMYRRLFSPGSCSCGARFRSVSAEAVHRHNFPALCRRPRARRKAVDFGPTDVTLRALGAKRS